jgi:hypothetical protein
MASNEPLANSLVRERRESTAETKRGDSIAPRQGTPCHQPAEQVERRWKRRTGQTRRPAVAIDHVDSEPILEMNVRARADAIEKAEGVPIAAEQHVLPVVHALAGGGIGEGGRAATERRSRLEHEDALPSLREARRSRQPGAPAPDHDGIVPLDSLRSLGTPHQRANIARAHSVIAVSAR